MRFRAVSYTHLDVYKRQLWNEAFELENELSEADEAGASDGEMDSIDEDLGEVYGEIDYVASHLPEEVVTKLAHDMADETRAINEEIRKANPNGLTDEQIAELHAVSYTHLSRVSIRAMAASDARRNSRILRRSI